MQAQDVAQYLKDHPQFFEDYADEIAEIYVPHPHGGHAIPIAERQILALRDKNAELAGKLAELVRFGAENDATTERLHRSTLALFAAPDLEATLAVLCHSLREDFAVPHVAVRLWGRVPEQSYLPELAATSAEVREYAERLDAPATGHEAVAESAEWFDQEARFNSALAAKDSVSTASRRTQDRTQPVPVGVAPFENCADTDWTQQVNREWIERELALGDIRHAVAIAICGERIGRDMDCERHSGVDAHIPAEQILQWQHHRVRGRAHERTDDRIADVWHERRRCRDAAMTAVSSIARCVAARARSAWRSPQ